jgi:hypothetical protein
MNLTTIRIIILFILLYFFPTTLYAQVSSISRNQEVINTMEKYGPSISPTYDTAVCTELVIGVLEHLCELDSMDKNNIRIIVTEDVYMLIENGSPQPKGVYYALTISNKGIPIDDHKDALPGDFVQFWYPNSWGHCGVLHSIDLENKTMKLYSSFPSTEGYGIQEFDIPDYCFFVRLKDR